MSGRENERAVARVHGWQVQPVANHERRQEKKLVALELERAGERLREVPKRGEIGVGAADSPESL